MYINPIELLGLSTIESLDEIDENRIRKEKRKLFAEIDLSDNGNIKYHGKLLTKGNCEKAIDELNLQDYKMFFFYLSNNVFLNEFLINGNPQLFSTFKGDNILKLPNFISFVSPYYSIQYNNALFKAYKENDELLFTSILKAPQLFNQSDVNIAYKSISTYLNSKIVEFEKLKKDIDNEESDFNDNNIIEVVDLIKQAFPSALINLLPNYFESQILRIAKTINYLSNSILWLGEETTLVSYELTGYLLTLKIDGLDRPTFEENYNKIKKWHEEKIEKKKNAPIIKKWAGILLHIRELTEQTEEKKIEPETGFSLLNNLLKINELNSLPSFADEIRRQVAFSVRSLSISMWNTHDDILNAIKTIQLAMTINVFVDDTKKLREDLLALKEIEKNYGDELICHFCEKNRPKDGEQICITLYKIYERNYIPGRSSFNYMEVELPRCSNCKNIHTKGNNLKYFLFVFVTAIGIFLGGTAFQNFFFGALSGAGLGWLTSLYAKKYFYSKINTMGDSKSILSNHPIVYRKIIEGWSLSRH